MAIEDLHTDIVSQVHALIAINTISSKNIVKIKTLLGEFTSVYEKPNSSVSECKAVLDQITNIIEEIKSDNCITNEQFEKLVLGLGDSYYSNLEL